MKLVGKLVATRLLYTQHLTLWLSGAVGSALDLLLEIVGGFYPERCTVECDLGQVVHRHLPLYNLVTWSKQAHCATHQRSVHGPAASAGVWLRGSVTITIETSTDGAATMSRIWIRRTCDYI